MRSFDEKGNAIASIVITLDKLFMHKNIRHTMTSYNSWINYIDRYWGIEEEADGA